MTFNELWQHRVWCAAIAGSIVIAAPAGFAHADAPGPTDYLSVIVEVTTSESLPLVDDAAITIEGHDSFLSVTVARGTTVEIPGYEGEKYLKMESDCTAYENQRSMSTWYNKDRYGSDFGADVVDHDAAPDWLQIASNCTLAWHDHRIHYMSPQPPVNAKPGDVLVSDSISFTVDGVPVNVRVESSLVERPSLLAPLLAAAGALLLVVGVNGRTSAALRTLMVAASVLGLVIGGAQYLWAAPGTGPQLTSFVVPLLATVLSGSALLLNRQSSIQRDGVQLMSSIFLALWVLGRKDVLDSALLPTSLPYWVDRAGTAAIGVVACAAAGYALVGLWQIANVNQPSPLQE
ncbi:MAG: hypothetical protein CL447_05660 [Acidimicrobiaceae bacterium]|nr:hypothetical protein [Acidimicrobiaceae bacterium]|tara:strand:- start:241 stop:1281 length:1041 start_codon:yes stop_codon:yes gene_type:complete